MQKTRLASVEVGLRWTSHDASHMDRCYFPEIDLARDTIVAGSGAARGHLETGQMITTSFTPEDTGLERDNGLVRTLARHRFKTRPRPHVQVTPRVGRFYPRDFIVDGGSASARDRRPCRCLAVDEDNLRFDFNLPFAGYGGELQVRVVAQGGDTSKHHDDGRNVLIESSRDGPGMQARLVDRETDFFYAAAFDRLDPREDGEFYRQPRLVQHLDSTAIEHIRAVYSRFVQPRMKVLDLMSSWVSHLPPLDDVQVTGLGMNEEELNKNTQLQHWLVHDLNRDTGIPQPQDHFDAAICTASVEYLVDPVRVFESVGRVLKAGAPFVVTFSDRWFPSKAIAVWEELHPFERMGLVLACFRQSGAFDRLATESIQHWPRPKDDKYAQRMLYSDPVFAVWGYRKAE